MATELFIDVGTFALAAQGERVGVSEDVFGFDGILLDMEEMRIGFVECLGFENGTGGLADGFERAAPVEAPLGIDDGLGEVDFALGDGLEVADEAAAGGEVIAHLEGGEEYGLAGESAAEGVGGDLGFVGEQARGGGTEGEFGFG